MHPLEDVRGVGVDRYRLSISVSKPDKLPNTRRTRAVSVVSRGGDGPPVEIGWVSTRRLTGLPMNRTFGSMVLHPQRYSWSERSTASMAIASIRPSVAEHVLDCRMKTADAAIFATYPVCRTNRDKAARLRPQLIAP
jgi:hypothetical protein